METCSTEGVPSIVESHEKRWLSLGDIRYTDTALYV